MEAQKTRPIWKRILQLAEYSGNVARLAALTGISYTTLKGAIDTRRGITAEKAALIVERTGCSALWLLTGRGQMFPEQDAAEGALRVAEGEAHYGNAGEIFITLKRDVKAGQTVVARIVAVRDSAKERS